VREIKKSTSAVYKSDVRQSYSGIKLSEFLDNSDITAKMYNILVQYMTQFGDVVLQSVLKGNFLKIRNAGKESWTQFNDVRQSYLTKSIGE
jgi:uncharacterized protein with gpF-like domain